MENNKIMHFYINIKSIVTEADILLKDILVCFLQYMSNWMSFSKVSDKIDWLGI